MENILFWKYWGHLGAVFLIIAVSLFIYRRYSHVIFSRLISFWKYFGAIIQDVFVSGLLFYAGYHLRENSESTKLSATFIITSVLVVTAKLLRYRKYSMGPASEISIMNENRADYGAGIRKFNERRPPQILKKISVSETRLIEHLIEKQIKLLEKRLRLHFGLGDREDFSASLLFFEPTTQTWHKWKTIHRDGEKEGHNSNGWPKNIKDFKLKLSLYNKPLAEAPFDTLELRGEGYNSVLSIPFYYPKNVESENYSEGNIFALLSYATNKQGFFSKLDNLSFLWFFLLESAIIERAAYRILRSLYDKPSVKQLKRIK